MSLKKAVKIFLAILLAISVFFMFKNDFLNIKNTDVGLNKTVNNLKRIQSNNDKNILENFLIINENKDTLSITDLLTTKKLIYRFSELHCDSCIINEFENLKKMLLSKLFKIENLIVISYYQSPRNLYLFKRLNNLQNFEIYNLENNSLGSFELETMGVPYFFILNKELKMSNTFVPIKQVNKRTDDYFKRIVSNLRE